MKTMAERIEDLRKAQDGMGYFARLRHRLDAIFFIAGLVGLIATGTILIGAFLWALFTLIMLLLAGVAGMALVLGVIFLVVALILAFF